MLTRYRRAVKGKRSNAFLAKANSDGLVKSPSAAFRCNFVVAAHLSVRLTPQFLRALHLELFTRPSTPGWRNQLRKTRAWTRKAFRRDPRFASPGRM